MPFQSFYYDNNIFYIYSYLYIPIRSYRLQGDYGDVSPRKKIRTDNKCKSFKWYLTEVYPELFIPGEAIASGEVIFKLVLPISLLPLPNYAVIHILITKNDIYRSKTSFQIGVWILQLRMTACTRRLGSGHVIIKVEIR